MQLCGRQGKQTNITTNGSHFETEDMIEKNNLYCIFLNQYSQIDNINSVGSDYLTDLDI